MLLRSEDEARSFVAERCTARAFDAVERFAGCLIAANNTQNLIAASTVPVIWTRHLADSAQLIDHVSRETGPWVDFGAGAGFPGLVIALMDPDREIALIESRALRVRWLEEMVRAFSLRNCRILSGDARKLAAIEAGVISARAFAPLARLIDISARFSTNATEWVLPKGRSAEQEVASMPPHLQKRFHVKHSVTDADARILLARGQLGVAG